RISMRITLMHNPKDGDAEHGKKQLMTALAKAGHHATYQSTKKSDYKKALKKTTDLVLAAGGDGTVGKIGCRLIDSGIPLSVLPLGTANNLARSLGFIASPEEIIGRLEGRKKLTCDVGFARGPRRKPRPGMASSISCAHAKAIAPFSWIIVMQGWQGKSPNSHCRFDGSASYRWFGKDRRNFTSTTNSGRAKNRDRNSAGKLRSQ